MIMLEYLRGAPRGQYPPLGKISFAKGGEKSWFCFLNIWFAFLSKYWAVFEIAIWKLNWEFEKKFESKVVENWISYEKVSEVGHEGVFSFWNWQDEACE